MVLSTAVAGRWGMAIVVIVVVVLCFSARAATAASAVVSEDVEEKLKDLSNSLTRSKDGISKAAKPGRGGRLLKPGE